MFSGSQGCTGFQIQSGRARRDAGAGGVARAQSISVDTGSTISLWRWRCRRRWHDAHHGIGVQVHSSSNGVIGIPHATNPGPDS
jgi:hypothetical protein